MGDQAASYVTVMTDALLVMSFYLPPGLNVLTFHLKKDSMDAQGENDLRVVFVPQIVVQELEVVLVWLSQSDVLKPCLEHTNTGQSFWDHTTSCSQVCFLKK